MLLCCICLPPPLDTRPLSHSHLTSLITGCWIHWPLSLHLLLELYLDRISLWLRFVLLIRKLSKTSSLPPSPPPTSPFSRFPLLEHLRNTSPSNWSMYQFYLHSFWIIKYALSGQNMVR